MLNQHLSTKRQTTKLIAQKHDIDYNLGNCSTTIKIDTITGTPSMIIVDLLKPAAPESAQRSKSRPGRKVVKGSNHIDEQLSQVINIIDKYITKNHLNNASAQLIRKLAVVLSEKTKLNMPFLAIRDKQSKGGIIGNRIRRASKSR